MKRVAAIKNDGCGKPIVMWQLGADVSFLKIFLRTHRMAHYAWVVNYLGNGGSDFGDRKFAQTFPGQTRPSDHAQEIRSSVGSR